MILIDTNVGVWLAYQPARLGVEARRLLEEAESVWFSAVLAIETTIKRMNGRLPTETDQLPEILRSAGLSEITVTSEHAQAMSRFPGLARHDPFDRLYLAQAHAEGARLVTADRRLLGLGLDWVVDARA